MNVRIINNQPNAAQRRALKKQVAAEFNNVVDRYNHDTIMQIIYILHNEFGFGQKRLERFAELLNKMQKDMDYRYELPESDIPWLCEKQLRESGIDVDALVEGGDSE